MSNFQFFGVEPIMINKVIHQTEGKFIYQPREMAQVINDYKNKHDYRSLEQIIRELFWISNQGRRPWPFESEQSFLVFVSEANKLLKCVRIDFKISDETYTFINPLAIALRLEREAQHLEEINDEYWDNILEIFYQLISLYIIIFDYWVSDFPQKVKLPTTDTMKYLLETDNNSDYEALITAFAKTQESKVEQILIDFSSDDEQAVRSLSEILLARYF